MRDETVLEKLHGLIGRCEKVLSVGFKSGRCGGRGDILALGDHLAEDPSLLGVFGVNAASKGGVCERLGALNLCNGFQIVKTRWLQIQKSGALHNVRLFLCTIFGAVAMDCLNTQGRIDNLELLAEQLHCNCVIASILAKWNCRLRSAPFTGC